MRFLGIGDSVELADLYLRLQTARHAVRVRVAEAEAGDVLSGMLVKSDGPLIEDLAWVGKRHTGGVIVFEGVGHGALQSRLRAEGYAVVGGSVFGDRLEMDRAFGQSVLHELGLPTAAIHEVDGFDAAIAFVSQTKQRYVLKFNGTGLSSTCSYVGMLDGGADMLAILQQQKRQWTFPEPPRLVLMNHLQGVEVGVGAWFNGTSFLQPPNLDWEHKRFFPGDLGELTGEMGTVVSFDNGHKLFEATLAKVAPLLRQAGHVGYVNLNLIVNDAGAWPLEFTCRFGYPGFALLGALTDEGWADTLQRLVEPTTSLLPTHRGYVVGVVLTVPPFPYPDGYARLSKGMPICFADDFTNEDRDALHYGEVGMQDGQLVTAGQLGYCMVVTGRGLTVADAQRDAYAVARKVAIPNVRYRNDIGDALVNRDFAELQRLGWLP